MFTLLFMHKNTAILPNHTRNTCFRNNANLNIPKLRTTFAQSEPYCVFVKFCIKFNVFIHDIYSQNSFKKFVTITIFDNMS